MRERSSAARFLTGAALKGLLTHPLKLSRLIKKPAGYEVVRIDDLGYVQQSREEREGRFTLLAERYERGSVRITSNLPFSKWEALFKDPMTPAAGVGRQVHPCVILELNIPSYRMEQAKKNRPDPPDASDASDASAA